ncbi:MAG: hypothetical protein HRU28_02490 [Rhizobiales bacterium]|nr:hypothetical protein [Hyphomicrobiales bacterium]
MFKLINKIGTDKLRHFIGGSLLAWVLMVVWVMFKPPFLWLVAAHFSVSMGKEIIHDWLMCKGKFELLDAAYTFAPMLQLWWLLYALGFEVLL